MAYGYGAERALESKLIDVESGRTPMARDGRRVLTDARIRLTAALKRGDDEAIRAAADDARRLLQAWTADEPVAEDVDPVSARGEA